MVQLFRNILKVQTNGQLELKCKFISFVIPFDNKAKFKTTLKWGFILFIDRLPLVFHPPFCLPFSLSRCNIFYDYVIIVSLN